MKKMLAVLLACVMVVLCIAGCQKGEQGVSAPAAEGTKAIAAELIDKATVLYGVYHGESEYTECLPAGTTVTVDGVTVTLPHDFCFYRHSSKELGEIDTLNDLRAATLAVYTEDTAQDKLFKHYFTYAQGDELPKFIEHDGKLYVGAGGRGMLYEYNTDTIKFVRQEQSECEFTIAYERVEYNEQPTVVDREIHGFIMKNTAKGWRLATLYEENA